MNSVPMSIVARRSLAAAALLLSLVTCVPAHAQFGFGFGNRQGVVGGVSVDAEGTVRSATTVEQQGRLSELRKATSKPANDLAAKTELRMVSLTKLQTEIEKALAANEPFSEEVLFLAGLQRIEYVFVYPDKNDIVLAGPAEGWVVREDASVVGETSGRPVLQLEDLIVAMRSTKATRQQPMSVSIDPTAEGQVRVRELLKQARGGPGFDPRRMEPALKEAFGPQVVSLTAIPKDSRMANTLVAADYRMKRLAMNLEESPVAGLPSYMEMIRNGGLAAGTQPRWWMACDYDAILHSEDMLAWKLSGRGIKAMTEEEIVDSTGARSQTGKSNKLAQKWSDLFTEKFDELCTYNAAFGDLRNLMDLNIVATVIDGHELERVAGCDFGLLKGTAGSLQTPQWQTPKTITPECSFIRGRSGWTVSASGGVEINSWKIVSKQSKVDSSVQTVRAKAENADGHWWWN